jgi:hypothetical protein
MRLNQGRLRLESSVLLLKSEPKALPIDSAAFGRPDDTIVRTDTIRTMNTIVNIVVNLTKHTTGRRQHNAGHLPLQQLVLQKHVRISIPVASIVPNSQMARAVHSEWIVVTQTVASVMRRE